VANSDIYKEKYTEYMLTDATTQRELAAKIAEMTSVLDADSITPSVTGYATGVIIADAQTGDGDSTDTFDFGNNDRDSMREPTLVRIAATAGTTPTCTYAIQGSIDGTNFTALEIADVSDPTSFNTNTFDITITSTVVKIVKAGQRYRYLKVVFSANTAVTNTVDVYPLGD